MKIYMNPRANRFASTIRISSGRTPRVTLLISLAFMLKTVIGCIDPVWDFDFSFNKITVGNLDNSGIYATETDGNTMYATAVAFKVTISDETLHASGILRRSNTEFSGFTPVSAMSPESRYHPRHRITGISIVTLEDMSPGISAGTDVTGLFVAHLPHFITLDFLYLNAEELPSALNLDFYPNEPSVSFQLFCRENIAGNAAQFLITVTLSDESTLSATTNPITLVRSE